MTEITCWSENSPQPLIVFVVSKPLRQREQHQTKEAQRLLSDAASVKTKPHHET